jgi:hypothetical protein
VDAASRLPLGVRIFGLSLTTEPREISKSIVARLSETKGNPKLGFVR